MSRIASWPHWYEPNPYLSAFYGALETHGVEHASGLPLEPDELAAHGVDALHIHWAYPYWRDPPAALGRIRRAFGFHRRLRAVRRRGMALLWTVHNLEHHEGGTALDRLGRSALRAADLTIYTSRWARAAAHRGGDAAVVPIGSFDTLLPPPVPRAEARAAEGLPADAGILLCFGQIRPYKGFDVAIEALERVPADVLLILAGRPVVPLPEAARRRAESGRRVILRLGELATDELVRLLGAADGVVLPYRRITGSAALLTALSRSRGVIVSDLPYFREVLADEPLAAELAPPGNARALAGAIERFLERPAATRDAAAARVAATLDWNRLVEPVVEWLEARGLRGARAPRG